MCRSPFFLSEQSPSLFPGWSLRPSLIVFSCSLLGWCVCLERYIPAYCHVCCSEESTVITSACIFFTQMYLHIGPLKTIAQSAETHLPTCISDPK